MIEQWGEVLSHAQAWHWAAFGGVLLVIELVTGTTYLLWTALAAFAVAAAMLFMPLSFAQQLGVFGVAAIALTLAGRAIVNKLGWTKAGGDRTLNAPAKRMTGQHGSAAETFANGMGRVKLGDTVWRAESQESISIGDAVEVVSASGATVKVKRAVVAAIAEANA